MSATAAKITSAGSRNSLLLSTLSTTDAAPSALAQQNEYLAQLQGQLAASAKRLAAADASRKKELKEHASYRDSVMKRFAYKATGKEGKFNERAAKEEREYFDALAAEHKEAETKKTIEAWIAEAQRVLAQIEVDVAKHDQAQRDLDALYADVFGGPSGSGFEAEDAAEGRVAEAQRKAAAAGRTLQAEQQALALLGDAVRAMTNAQLNMQDALRASRRDMFGGGTMADMMERNALARADRAVGEARLAVERANRLSPANVVAELPRVQIAQGNLLGDVFFDNIWTDMAFHEKIKQSNIEVANAVNVVSWEVQRGRQRVDDAKSEWDNAGRELAEKRRELQKIREETFAKVLRERGGA